MSSMTDHPSWCDPRLCETDPGTNIDHRDAPLRWSVAGDDIEISIGLSRLDMTDFPARGDVLIHLGLANTQFPISAESDLTPSDARMLAAVLVSAAERAEAHHVTLA